MSRSVIVEPDEVKVVIDRDTLEITIYTEDPRADISCVLCKHFPACDRETAMKPCYVPCG